RAPFPISDERASRDAQRRRVPVMPIGRTCRAAVTLLNRLSLARRCAVRVAEMREEDLQLVAALREGDEAAFLAVVRRHHPSMVRVARAFVASDAVAEEVVQEAWLGVLDGIGQFEGRSSLRSWLFSIVANRARSRAAREARSAPFSSWDEPDEEPAV